MRSPGWRDPGPSNARVNCVDSSFEKSRAKSTHSKCLDEISRPTRSNLNFLSDDWHPGSTFRTWKLLSEGNPVLLRHFHKWDISDKRGRESDFMKFVLGASAVTYENLTRRLPKPSRVLVQSILEEKTTRSRDAEKDKPLFTGRQDCLRHLPALQDTDIQGQSVELDDVLNIKLTNVDLKMFDQSWEETLMAMKTQPDEIILEGIYYCQFSGLFFDKQKHFPRHTKSNQVFKTFDRWHPQIRTT